MEQILEWYNLIFYLPLAVGLLFALGAGFDLGHDAEIDTDVHADMHVDTDADHDADHDSDSDDSQSSILGFLGFGRVPIAISLMSLFLIFAGAGLISNIVIKLLIQAWSGFALLSVAVAAMCSFFGTAFVSRVVSRVMPTTETSSVTKHDLIGCYGKVILENSLRGIAQISNPEGALYQIKYKADRKFPYGAKIITIDYDPASDTYTIDADPTVA